MKLIKIGAIWCSGCLVMNKVWNKLIKEYNFSYETYDIDMDEDEVEKYNVGEKLPVFIVMENDKEIKRFIGEYSYSDMVNNLREVGLLNEESN
ncbi:MAG: thioredoxin family protein [Mollicutes bacterium]|nr:thioredoxin family protein [Mollicutes bacterium]MDY5875315.1 thioredoxin family protein [Bacilli bacterium]